MYVCAQTIGGDMAGMGTSKTKDKDKDKDKGALASPAMSAASDAEQALSPLLVGGGEGGAGKDDGGAPPDMTLDDHP